MAELEGVVLNNRYRVEKMLGRGGMAEVYKVWDSRRATHLALKLLREDMAQDSVFLRRFKREAQTVAKLQHPNIVRLYGLEQEDLHAFMLMEYVEGTSLRAEIFRNREAGIGYDRIVQVMRAVCSALYYAHSENMVHCDIKPGNIMVEESGRILLSDFGIARLTDAATATMVGAGTPAYMAPEQILGKDPTSKTDIYALGIVLFEMLTGGERPFTGEHAESTGSTSEKVRWEQLHLSPPSPTKWNPNIPPELEAVVMKCLEKAPENRYQNALDLLNAIELAVQGSVETSASALVPPSDQEVIDEQEFYGGKKSSQIEKYIGQIGGWRTTAIAGSALIFILFCLLGTSIISSRGVSALALFARDTETPTPTNTSIPTSTFTLTPTDTDTPTPTLTETPTPTPTETPVPTNTTVPVAKLYMCSQSRGKACIYSFGKVGSILLVEAEIANVSSPYLYISGNYYECKTLIPSDRAHQFCEGPFINANEYVKISLYNGGFKIAEGYFTIPNLGGGSSSGNPRDKYP